MTTTTVNGLELFTWAVMATYVATSASDAMDMAYEEGAIYNPEMGEYVWLGERAVKLPHN